MLILITDIHGFIGSNLVETFKGKNIIYGLDDVNSEMDGVSKIFAFDELKRIPEVDVVIHLAGKSTETNDLSEALAYFEGNAGLTRKIFNWFTQSTAKTFIYFSSVKVAASHLIDGIPLTEEMEPKPSGALGESKLMAENYILNLWTFGKKIYVLRPSIIDGSGSYGSRKLRMMFKWVQKGWPFPFGNFECRRSFTTIDNLCYVIKRMLELDIPGGIYHVVDDESLQLSEIYEIIGHVLHKKMRIWYLNKGVIHFAAWVGTRFNGYFNEYQYQKLSSDLVVSNEKIKKALGIQRMPVCVVDGLNKSLLTYEGK